MRGASLPLDTSQLLCFALTEEVELVLVLSIALLLLCNLERVPNSLGLVAEAVLVGVALVCLVPCRLQARTIHTTRLRLSPQRIL